MAGKILQLLSLVLEQSNLLKKFRSFVLCASPSNFFGNIYHVIILLLIALEVGDNIRNSSTSTRTLSGRIDILFHKISLSEGRIYFYLDETLWM